MWSFGSIRDSIRENARAAHETAKAAAQVAQGVLQAAAAENDDQNPEQFRSDLLEQSPIDNWDNWSSGQHEDPPFSHPTSGAVEDDVPKSTPQTLRAESYLPPPPPSADTNPPVLSGPIVSLPQQPNKQRRARSSRYVVAGVQTTPTSTKTALQFSQPQPTAPTSQLNSTQDFKCEATDGKSVPNTSLLSPALPSPPHSDVEHKETKQTQVPSVEGFAPTSSVISTSEPVDRHTPWDIQTDNSEGDGNQFLMNPQLAPSTASVEQSATGQTNASISDFDLLLEDCDNRMNHADIKTCNRPFCSHTEQNDANTTNEDNLAVNFKSQGHNVVENNTNVESPTSSFFSFMGQNVANAIDDESSAYDPLSRSQKCEDQDVSNEVGVPLPAPSSSSTDYFSKNLEHVEDPVLHLAQTPSALMSLVAPTTGSPLSFSREKVKKNITFDGDSTDWFDTTATQLENISKSVEEPSSCTSEIPVSRSEHANADSFENPRAEAPASEMQTMSFRADGFEAQAWPPAVENLSPTARRTGHISPPTIEDECPAQGNQNFQSIPSSFEITTVESNDARVDTMRYNTEILEQSIDPFPRRKHTDDSIAEALLEHNDGQEISGIAEPSAVSCGATKQFSPKKKNSHPDAETYAERNVVDADDVNWFSDCLIPEHGSAKVFSEMIGKAAQNPLSTKATCQVSSILESEGALGALSTRTDISEKKTEFDSGIHSGERIFTRSTLNEESDFQSSIPHGNTTVSSPTGKPLFAQVESAKGANEPRTLSLPGDTAFALDFIQENSGSESAKQGLSFGSNVDGFNHLPQSASSKPAVKETSHATFTQANEKPLSCSHGNFIESSEKLREVGTDVPRFGNLTNPLPHEGNKAPELAFCNREEGQQRTEMKEKNSESDQCAVGEFQSNLEEDNTDRAFLLKRVKELENLLCQSHSELNAREKEINHKLKVAETDAEIAKFERQKMAETCNQLRDEVSSLQNVRHESTRALTANRSKLKELELQLQCNKADNNSLNNVPSKQFEEQVSRLQVVIDEKKNLFDEKWQLENEKGMLETQLNELKKQLLKLQCDLSNLTSERDELKSNCDNMYMQVKENQKRAEAAVMERDLLIRERTSYSSESTSARERSLAEECEQRVHALALAQKKVASATSKIEKLTAQRNTFQRQRDDAGARLRAAGAEFVSLNLKLCEANRAKEHLHAQLLAARDERDNDLAKIQGLAVTEAELNACQERLYAREEELNLVKNALKESQKEVCNAIEERSSFQVQIESFKKELHIALRAQEIAERKIELMKSRIEQYEREHIVMREESQSLKSSRAELESKIRQLENEIELSKGESSKAIKSAENTIMEEQQGRKEAEDKISILEKRISECNVNIREIRSAITSCLNLGKVALENSPLSEGPEFVWSEILTFGEGYNEPNKEVAALCEVTRIISEQFAQSNEYRKELETKYSETNEELQRTTSELLAAQKLVNEAGNAKSEVDEAFKQVEMMKLEKREREIASAALQQQFEEALNKKYELLQRLDSLQEQYKLEREETNNRTSEDSARADRVLKQVLSKLQSVWDMIEKCIGEEQVQFLYEQLDQGEELEYSSVEVIALRGTALVVAELNRRRAEASDMERRLEHTDAELARLTERSELAEQERDALKGAVDRMERKASNAHLTGREEARMQFEKIVSHLEDEITELRDELKLAKEKVSRSEKEIGELRGLCNKLTAQLNSRTNELDEAEEKLAYLQDQASTLEEDLQEAHRRLKRAEEESVESRRVDVENLSRELDKRSAELESIEKECIRLREVCDEAERKSKEHEIEAKIHRQAEENLQIAIEQLEAEQESAVEQKTIALEKKVRDAEAAMKRANEVARGAVASESQLKLRDDEIKELRGALGKLSDERVELKLELEKSLSRLHHPDAEEQLVDRRVVRQLLVSYLRVDSVRRRDVLQLMSRMLAFSESDNVAVGLKRRALIDRLGSLVQAPEMDDATPPPFGTVSDRWIEFLMKEAEEGEDQERGW